MATSASENPTQSWEDLYNWACRAYGLTDKTIQILEEQDCNTAEALAALTEDDLTDLEITVGQRRLVANMLADLRTAWDHNLRLERELRRAFPRGKYMIKAYYSEEEEENEDDVLEAVTISATDNEQDVVLIYCKAYITFLKTGKLEDGDQLFTFVEEAVAKMNDGVYKGALLLLPQETFLPRSLAEKLLDEGDMFPLRHTDSFITDVRRDVKLLMDREEEEEDGEEDYHEELETGTPERSTDPLLQTKTDVDPLLHLLHLLQPHPPSYTPSQLSSDDWQNPQPLLDEYWRGPDKVDPKTPVTFKTGKPDSR
ncbi:uncharacterized protein LOC118432036 [Branchiostoma floridae]|uniref:Uncharacterized protein LOC118432036 n=1 Tax=Branchiostoma floridae TaxID=7739 RepID=A0A9J7MEH2_BRAFL|nr:uncharacterized protein LOC118432036 [Branchiostoma floridae]